MPAKPSLSALVTRALFAAACASFLVLLVPPHDAFGRSIDVVASGLNNPRGIAVRGNSIVYVAEAGRGGSRCAEARVDGETAEFCFGNTGTVMKIWPGGQLRLVRGLPSVSEPGGAFAAGPHDVGRVGHRIFITVGTPVPPARPLFGASTRLQGKLVRWLHGDIDVVADLAAYEQRRNPAGGEVDSNPYGLHVLSARRQLVVDAGGNDLLSVTRGGDVSTVAVFPPQMVAAPPFLGLPPGTNIPAESVPTAVTRGPDGAYYVGELTGFPFPVGKARVWRVEPGEDPEVFATGFTNIIDITFGANGSLYVLEIARAGLLAGEAAGEPPAGRLVRVAPNGTRTELAAGRLVAPGGVAVAKNGWVYVTNRSVFPGAGEVLRIRP